MKKGLLIICCLSISLSLTSQDLFDWLKVNDLRLNFTIDNWDDELDSLKTTGEEKRLIASISVNGVVYDSVGVRYKGNSSYFNVRKSESSKLPFNIKFDYIKKKQALPNKYTTLKLSNVFRDPSFIREVLSYEIAHKYMPAPRANFATLYVNDQFLGLYNNTESIEDEFLKKHFDKHKGAFFKCDPDWRSTAIPGCIPGDKAALIYQGEDSICYQHLYEIKSKTGWAELIELTKILNNEPDKIEEILDVDQALWMLAFNNVVVNLDSYSGRLCHNYYLFEGKKGIFHPIIWDMNLSFGGFRYSGEESRLTNAEMQQLSPFLHYRNKKRPLIHQLLQYPLYRKVYLAHMRTILHENFSEGQYLNRMEEIQTVIDSYVKEDSNKLYTYEAFGQNVNHTSIAGDSEIIGIAELMEARVKYLNDHPLIQTSPPEIKNISHIQDEENTIINAEMKNGQQLYLAYRSKGFRPFSRVEMKDDGKHHDKLAGDGVFGVVLEKTQIIQYYLLAENDKSAFLSPERASQEYYQIEP